MEITGRLIADAIVSTTKNDKQVVNFKIAVNDSYKPKNGEVQRFTTYISCGYWFGTGIAKLLRKGDAVTVNGRLNVRPWMSGNNEPRATLEMFVKEVHPFFSKREEHAQPPENTSVSEVSTPEAVDDLPF